MPNLSGDNKHSVRIVSPNANSNSVRVHSSLTGVEFGNVTKIEFDPIEPNKPVTAKISVIVDSLDIKADAQVDETEKTKTTGRKAK